MSCLNPITIRNRRYDKFLKPALYDYCKNKIGLHNCTFDNRLGFLPPDYYIQIPCGTCFECLKAKRRGWYFRLMTELRNSKRSSFVTLTFDNDNLLKFKDNYRLPLKLYIDRLRKTLGYRPRYWFCSEFGDEEKYSGRLHFHGIFFNTSPETFSYSLQRLKWIYGHSFVGRVTEKTASYVTKYLLKFDKDFKPIIQCSNGIGSSYITRSIFDWHINGFDFRSYCVLDGKKFPLCPYYKSKLLDDDIKLCLMLNRYNDLRPKSYYLGSKVFTNEADFVKSRLVSYKHSLRLGTSKEYEKLNKNRIEIKSISQIKLNYNYVQSKLRFSED